jgi:spore photoproduct lyase
LIEALADLDNVLLELKSKTDLVDHLLELPRKGNAVIAFSLNPDTVAAEEEGVAAPVEHRLAAARRAAAAGYRIAFHFDPVIALPEWQDHYGPLIDALGQFSTDQVVWISLGTIRYTPALRDKMGDRPYLLDEFVPGRDGKYRYLQQERVGVYRWLRERLYRAIPAPVYMCMESATVWRKVFGALPQQLPELAPIFSPVRIPGPQRTERTEERTE